MVTAWLEIDAARPPFSVIATEDAQRVSVGALNMQLRLDRLDRLSDGNLALIDYKTGTAEIRQWLGERPDEPQLPLYLQTARDAESIAVLAFARMKRGNTFGFAGFSAAPDMLPGTQPIEDWRGRKEGMATSWDELVADWQRAIAQLVQGFATADASVDPKHGALTCARCDLHGLCRVGERLHATQDDAS